MESTFFSQSPSPGVWTVVHSSPIWEVDTRSPGNYSPGQLPYWNRTLGRPRSSFLFFAKNWANGGHSGEQAEGDSGHCKQQDGSKDTRPQKQAQNQRGCTRAQRTRQTREREREREQVSERDFTVYCSWRCGVGGETDRKRPQKREHRTHTYTHAHLSTPRLAWAPGGSASGSWLWLRSILLSGRPPLSLLLLAGPWHCTTAPRKPNFQVAGQPEGHQLLKANLPLKVTAKSWRNHFSPEVLVPEDCKCLGC